ncbi:hypothetical protein LCGC14_0293720 [marine sediment metagenome]|uniref:Uncharacterized protein n=1 Tax=marine sediment metagenome TaxID=412755 RepID=A0A0F9WDI5_9ZZZZ|nr:hypothetical protein [Halomonas sp.]HDZ49119.1 hypothetical protein [Halomonas sp.]HEB04499.1 hypothetical protein [Halomonas sp.]
MANNKKIASNPVIDVSQPILLWWNEHWLKSSLPLAKIHLVWLENVAQTMEMEALFFQAMAESSEKLNQCLAKNGGLPRNDDLNQCYQEMVQTLTDAHLQRIENVAQLSHEFRRCLWEGI